jgi:hypothetical protein
MGARIPLLNHHFRRVTPRADCYSIKQFTEVGKNFNQPRFSRIMSRVTQSAM